jgi:hypothetical protein
MINFISYALSMIIVFMMFVFVAYKLSSAYLEIQIHQMYLEENKTNKGKKDE